MNNTKKRCAIYTRKSVEDAVEKEFNSCDAQREAGELLVASQRGNHWECIPKLYNDYGLSGGNTNRPALKELLSDCEAGLVDIVVVYKVDRLSRSIVDFGELSKKFDKWGVSFVSVTQDINTSTSSGRMMLNILMTFAQYEREIIAERIKDKMSASRKKGKWVGGVPPYGYKVENKKLAIIKNEVETVKWIFQRFIEVQSPKIIAQELNRQSIKTHNDGLWNSTHIQRMLRNHTYIGEVNYNGHICIGEHQGFLSRSVWERVQEILQSNTHVTDFKGELNNIAPLKGVLHCPYCNSTMTPTYSKKGKRHYHYYLCVKDNKRAESKCPIKRIPAGDIEKIVMEQITKILQMPEILSVTSQKTGIATGVLKTMFEQDIWAGMEQSEQNRLISLLVEKISIYDDCIDFEFRTEGMKLLIEEL